MKKFTIILTIIVSLVITVAVGFYAGYQYVIHNQYYEECPHADNCYHIVIDGNAHEYEYATE